MATRIVFDGMTEFKAALRNLPEHLRDEATVIVESAATNAQENVQRVYPVGPTGNLQRRVTTTRLESRGKFAAGAIVKSAAKHAHLYERGTRSRRTSSGANRGAMPPAPQGAQMIPIVIRWRRAMVKNLKDLVRKAGFQVT